jgi:hypothetical protein
VACRNLACRFRIGSPARQIASAQGCLRKSAAPARAQIREAFIEMVSAISMPSNTERCATSSTGPPHETLSQLKTEGDKFSPRPT